MQKAKEQSAGMEVEAKCIQLFLKQDNALVSMESRNHLGYHFMFFFNKQNNDQSMFKSSEKPSVQSGWLKRQEIE